MKQTQLSLSFNVYYKRPNRQQFSPLKLYILLTLIFTLVIPNITSFHGISAKLFVVDFQIAGCKFDVLVCEETLV